MAIIGIIVGIGALFLFWNYRIDAVFYYRQRLANDLSKPMALRVKEIKSLPPYFAMMIQFWKYN